LVIAHALASLSELIGPGDLTLAAVTPSAGTEADPKAGVGAGAGAFVKVRGSTEARSRRPGAIASRPI